MTSSVPIPDTRPAPPERYKIAEWWEEKAYTAYPEYQCRSFDWQEPPYGWPFVIDLGEPSCFACHGFDPRARTYDSETGYTNLKRIWDDSRLERAHIVPYALGGGNEVSDFLLLCKRCHREAPDTGDPRYMLQWACRHETQGARAHADFTKAARYFGLQAEEACQIHMDHMAPACLHDIARRCVQHFGAGVSTASQVAALLAHAKGCGMTEDEYFGSLIQTTDRETA